MSTAMRKHIVSLISLLSVTGFIVHPVDAQSDYKLAEQDSLALVAFYHATNGPAWTSNQPGFGFDDLSSEWQGFYDGGFNSWFDGPAKDWFGVRVEKRPISGTSDSTYRVTWLWPVIGRRTDGQNQLSGYIPREVALLTALEQFRVNGNNGLSWTELPDDIYHPTLEHLDIESAWLGGYISDGLRNCTGIRKMNFRYNYIDYMPTLDFLDTDALYNLDGTQWLYSTRLSFAIIEKTIDYFYTISPNPKEFNLEMRDLFDVGDETEVVASLGSQVVLECTSAGDQEAYITYQWYKNGLSMFGKTSRTLTISSVQASDYADYTVKITNDYVKEYDQNSNYGEVFTKPFHLVEVPVPPVLEWVKTSYNGKEILLRFSKPMDTQASGYEGFTVRTASKTISASGARTEGRLNTTLVLTLTDPLTHLDTIWIDYNGSTVIDQNNAPLAAFSDTAVWNQVREGPQLVSALTTKDGSGIEVYFNRYIDANSVDPGDFQVTRTGDNSISSATLLPGEIDDHISKSVLLTLAQPITDSAEVISLEYVQGDLSGFLSGIAPTSGVIGVTNQVSVDLTKVLIRFEDGSLSAENVFVEPSWRIDPVPMYDDGTNGDSIAGDHTWSTMVALPDDDYNWDVIIRDTSVSYDTVWYEDPVTGIITLTLTPSISISDSLLSEYAVLEFTVSNDSVTGTTSFGVMNLSVTFNLSIQNVSGTPYLMGIDDDWATGIPMNMSADSQHYTVTVTGYTVNDLIRYNYRDGSNWENQTVEPRSYTVKQGENITNDVFGEFITSLHEYSSLHVKVFPNPVSTVLNLSGLKDFQLLEIYDLSGSLVFSQQLHSEGRISITVSDYRAGIYLIRLNTRSGQRQTMKFFKY
jgi:hypothetical protein